MTELSPEVRAVLERALEALQLQPESGVASWSPASAALRVGAKRAIRRLLDQGAVKPKDPLEVAITELTLVRKYLLGACQATCAGRESYTGKNQHVANCPAYDLGLEREGL